MNFDNLIDREKIKYDLYDLQCSYGIKGETEIENAVNDKMYVLIGNIIDYIDKELCKTNKELSDLINKFIALP